MEKEMSGSSKEGSGFLEKVLSGPVVLRVVSAAS